MRNFLLIVTLFCAAGLQAQNIVLSSFASGLTSPVEITHAKDSRLFVVQQNGLIKIVQPNGSINTTNFLSISTKVLFNGERGLLGLAFHPNYATNGFFYVYYNNTAGNITLAQYSVSSTNPDVADPTSEKILLNITKTAANHNGGSIHFAPDGNLWISTGDGGGSGDPNNNAQNINSLLGKMFRINVNTNGTYTVPTDNPYVGVAGADEIWSYGMRNAWKFSFDLTSGNVLIADVGQGAIEEINRMPISQGGINYGWRCYEGNNTYNNAGCAPASTMTFPVAVYDHSGGKCSITGGYVYRGSQYPALSGKYIFADYCSTQLGILDSSNAITWSTAFTGNNFATFGEDVNKELYVAAVNNGTLYKVSTTTLATENNTSDKIQLYPNPASDKIYLKGLKSKSNTAEFTSTDGRKVLEAGVNGDGSIDISALNSGLYFVTIKSDLLKVHSETVLIK